MMCFFFWYFSCSLRFSTLSLTGEVTPLLTLIVIHSFMCEWMQDVSPAKGLCKADSEEAENKNKFTILISVPVQFSRIGCTLTGRNLDPVHAVRPHSLRNMNLLSLL